MGRFHRQQGWERGVTGTWKPSCRPHSSPSSLGICFPLIGRGGGGYTQHDSNVTGLWYCVNTRATFRKGIHCHDFLAPPPPHPRPADGISGLMVDSVQSPALSGPRRNKGHPWADDDMGGVEAQSGRCSGILRETPPAAPGLTYSTKRSSSQGL